MLGVGRVLRGFAEADRHGFERAGVERGRKGGRSVLGWFGCGCGGEEKVSEDKADETRRSSSKACRGCVCVRAMAGGRGFRIRSLAKLAASPCSNDKQHKDSRPCCPRKRSRKASAERATSRKKNVGIARAACGHGCV